jgi:ABC-2 type transport system permease protein
MNTFVLFGSMLRLHAIEQRRYLLNTVMGLVMAYAAILFLLTGAQVVGGAQAGFGRTSGSLVVGYFVFLISLNAFSSLAGTIGREATLGTLEQLALSPAGLTRVLLARSLAGLVFQVATMMTLMVVVALTTGQDLRLDLFSVLPLLFMVLMAAQGVGFALGGLAILYKQVSALLRGMQFVFLGLVALPAVSLTAARAIPLAWGTHLINRVMVHGATLTSIPAGDLAILAAGSVAYLGVGLLAFRWAERVARDRGLLGHY